MLQLAIAICDEKYLKENIEYELHFREQHYKKRSEYARTVDGEERRRYQRNANGTDADARADSRKGLGYDGASASGGGGFSAEGLRTNENLDNRRTDGGASTQAGRSHSRVLQQTSGYFEEADEREPDREQEDSFADEGTKRTGWEESRENYERFLVSWSVPRGRNSRGVTADRQAHMADSHSDIGSGFGGIGGAVHSAVHAMAGVNDEGEDPEERRKRIEAEQAAQNFGAVLGTAIGVALALANENEDELPKELENEQHEWSQSM